MSASLLILRHSAVRKLADLVTFNVLAADWVLIFVFCFKIRWLKVLFLLMVCKPSCQATVLKFKPKETDYSPDCFENGISHLL
jgi:hypothetical protein